MVPALVSVYFMGEAGYRTRYFQYNVVNAELRGESCRVLCERGRVGCSQLVIRESLLEEVVSVTKKRGGCIPG